MIPAAKPFIGDEERHAVDRVLRSGMISRARRWPLRGGVLGGGGSALLYGGRLGHVGPAPDLLGAGPGSRG